MLARRATTATAVLYYPERLIQENEDPLKQEIVMTPSLLLRILAMTLLVSCTAVMAAFPSHIHRRVSTAPESTEERCPPCELLFSKLEKTGRYGKLAQEVRVQERGEPKSGTGFMYLWASATLIHTCDYLRELFGEQPKRLIFVQSNLSIYIFIPRKGMHILAERFLTG